MSEKPLNKIEAEKHLVELSGWTSSKDNKAISKEYKFQDFIGAINFVERVAETAELAGHHPDIHIFYNKVLLELSTHSIGGLSEKDFDLAKKIDFQ